MADREWKANQNKILITDCNRFQNNERKERRRTGIKSLSNLTGVEYKVCNFLACNFNCNHCQSTAVLEPLSGSLQFHLFVYHKGKGKQ